MRTTLTIDVDILSAARELAAQDGTTIGRVISDLARQSLTSVDAPPDAQAESFYGFTPLPPRGGIVTNEMVNAIREAEDI